MIATLLGWVAIAGNVLRLIVGIVVTLVVLWWSWNTVPKWVTFASSKIEERTQVDDKKVAAVVREEDEENIAASLIKDGKGFNEAIRVRIASYIPSNSNDPRAAVVKMRPLGTQGWVYQEACADGNYVQFNRLVPGLTYEILVKATGYDDYQSFTYEQPYGTKVFRLTF